MNILIRLIGLIIFFLILLRVDFELIITNIFQLDLRYILVGIILTPLVVVIKSFRWRSLLQHQNIDINSKDSFLIYFSSIYFGIVTPGGIGGEFIKAIYLKNEYSIALSKSILTIILDRLFDLYSYILLACLTAILLMDQLSLQIIVSLISLILLITPFYYHYLDSPYRIIHWLYYLVVKKLSNKMIEYINIERNEGFRKIILYGFALTIICQIIVTIQFYCISKAMNIEIGLIVFLFIVAASSLVSIIPISIAGIGTRDALLVYIFLRINLDTESALIFSSVLLFMVYVATGVFGLLAYLIKPLKTQV